MDWKINPWIRFLEGYCKGKNQIQDEYVRKVAHTLGLKPLEINFPWQQQILEKFNKENESPLIILTGTAGDGKTKLCRDIVKHIEGEAFNEDEWNSRGYFSTEKKTIVKDFSELKEDKALVVKDLLMALRTKIVEKPILVAVNDGILVEYIDDFIENAKEDDKELGKQLKEIIEDKINLGFSDCEGEELISLINLSKLNAKENMSLIFEAILNDEGWEQCDGCVGKERGICGIYSKYSLLKNNPHIIENLSNIILLLQLNNQHFTIRELLNLATNTLLASVPKSKALKVASFESSLNVMSCKGMSKVEHVDLFNNESTIEVGFWGMNIGPHKMHTTRPYSEINKLDFGKLSSNYWDKTLLDKSLRSYLIPLDSNNNLLNERRLEDTALNNEIWDSMVRRSRMQLYCYQNKDSSAFQLQKYVHFGLYLESIYKPLLEQETVDDIKIISMIILSLNRVFHGRYISENTGRDRLFVPEQGQGSIAPISIFHGEDIRERDIYIRSINDDVKLTGSRIEPILVLALDRSVEVKVSLTVELFDFLVRVSKGEPPNTTDPRLYKKLLILRSKISSRIRENRRIETYTIDKGEFKQVVLEVANG